MSDTAQHHDGPPQLPTVVDEAGDTPTWFPLVGLGLLALVLVVMVARAQLAPATPPQPTEPAEAAPTAVPE